MCADFPNLTAFAKTQISLPSTIDMFITKFSTHDRSLRQNVLLLRYTIFVASNNSYWEYLKFVFHLYCFYVIFMFSARPISNELFHGQNIFCCLDIAM